MSIAYHAPLSLNYASLVGKYNPSYSFAHPWKRTQLIPENFLTRKGISAPATPFCSGKKSASTGKVLCKLPDKTPPAVTGSSWKESILNSEVPVLVEFWASWCGPCKMVHPVIDEIAEAYAGKIMCFKLNTDKDPQVASEYGITKIPTILLFKNGEKRHSITGTMPKSVYAKAIDRCLAA